MLSTEEATRSEGGKFARMKAGSSVTSALKKATCRARRSAGSCSEAGEEAEGQATNDCPDSTREAQLALAWR